MMARQLFGGHLSKLFGNCGHGYHKRSQHTKTMIKYDEDLYKFFLHTKHEVLCEGVCWHREGVMLVE